MKRHLLLLSLLGMPGALGAADPQTAALASSSNQLAIDLHRSLQSHPGNLAFSPASVSLALRLAWLGARDPTAVEMGRVLRITEAPDAALLSTGRLLAQLNDPARTAYTLRVANRLFAEQSYALEKPFLDRLASVGAPVEELDFRRASGPSRLRINAWVARETADRIRDLVPPGAIDSNTRLALVNAIYLLADWLSPFTKEATRPRPFHGAGAPRDVATMHQTGTFRIGAADGIQVLEMPYRGDELAMAILLPDDRAGLPALERILDAGRLQAWITALKPERVAVALPKFTIDPPEPIALADVLKGLGMRLAFDPGRADFTGIAAPPDPADRLSIKEVFHKAFVKVDEKGTEAAAATAVLMQRATAMAPARPREFTADHPFLFVVRDLRSGLVLFMGRVAEPTA